MKRFIPLLFLACPAFAQQPDPAQALTAEWQGKVLQDNHVAERAQALVQAYQTMQAQFDAAKTELDYWHKWCGDKPACMAPAPSHYRPAATD